MRHGAFADTLSRFMTARVDADIDYCQELRRER